MFEDELVNFYNKAMEDGVLAAAKKENIKSHTLFKAINFTKEEAARNNPVYVAVVVQGLDICKYCGRSEAELEEHCATPRKQKEESAINFSEDDTRA